MVKVNKWYVYNANGLDIIDPKTTLKDGDLVQVVNKAGCPTTNTMGQCYVEYNDKFAGMVSTDSLTPAKLRDFRLEPKADYEKFIVAVHNDAAYNEDNKITFHKQSTAMLKALAGKLGLNAGEYSIRSNKAGIAVSGEITLHSDSLYIQFSQSRQGCFLWRTCNGRKDYCGGPNRWMKWEELQNLDNVAIALKLATN